MVPAPLFPAPEAQKIFESVFAGIDGYATARRAMERIHVLDDSLTYGEMTFEAMEKIIGELPETTGVFYDLGSGIGKAIVAAALLGNYSTLVGVEILHELHLAAELARRRLVIELERRLAPELPRPQLSFIESDMFTLDFSEADIVFVASTCFTDAMVTVLRRRATMLRSGRYIVTMTRTLQSTAFHMIKHFGAHMNWGDAEIFVYKKL